MDTPESQLPALPDLLQSLLATITLESTSGNQHAASSSWEGPPVGTSPGDIQQLASALRDDLMGKFLALQDNREQSRL